MLRLPLLKLVSFQELRVRLDGILSMPSNNHEFSMLVMSVVCFASHIRKLTHSFGKSWQENHNRKLRYKAARSAGLE